MSSLAAAAVDPASIPKVVFTHAHPDHIWGTTGADGTLHFPNARYYVSSPEWDIWMDPGHAPSAPQEMRALVAGVQAHIPGRAGRVGCVPDGWTFCTAHTWCGGTP